jgi:hypothetical protein
MRENTNTAACVPSASGVLNHVMPLSGKSTDRQSDGLRKRKAPNEPVVSILGTGIEPTAFCPMSFTSISLRSLSNSMP